MHPLSSTSRPLHKLFLLPGMFTLLPSLQVLLQESLSWPHQSRSHFHVVYLHSALYLSFIRLVTVLNCVLCYYLNNFSEQFQLRQKSHVWLRTCAVPGTPQELNDYLSKCEPLLSGIRGPKSFTYSSRPNQDGQHLPQIGIVLISFAKTNTWALANLLGIYHFLLRSLTNLRHSQTIWGPSSMSGHGY